MASSRSEELDDSNSENVYQCISMIDGNICKKDELYVKCPICKQRGRTFYCVECIKNGNFLHSKKKCFERFADKKVSKYKLDAKKAIILQSYEDMLSKKKQAENLKLEIYKSKEKIQLLKAGIQSCRGTIYNNNRSILELQTKRDIVLYSQSGFQKQLLNMGSLQSEMYTKVAHMNKILDLSRNDWHSLMETRIQELISHIFPISQVASQYHKNSSSSEVHCAELEEAQKTTYVSGQWVITGNAMDEYSIIKACIPSNGDYSAYTNWCAKHIHGTSRESLSAFDRYELDKAYGISAALAYTALLVNKIAFYMDAFVPKKTGFKEFCDQESDKTMFLHKVAKLNANIVQLCLLRGVDVSKIGARRTIENLLLLLQTKATEPSSLTSDHQILHLESVEKEISEDLLIIDENKYSNERKEAEVVEGGFHMVSEDDCLPFSEEASAQPVPAQTSLVSSVFSLLKAATGQR